MLSPKKLFLSLSIFFYLSKIIIFKQNINTPKSWGLKALSDQVNNKMTCNISRMTIRWTTNSCKSAPNFLASTKSTGASFHIYFQKRIYQV